MHFETFIVDAVRGNKQEKEIIQKKGQQEKNSIWHCYQEQCLFT